MLTIFRIKAILRFGPGGISAVLPDRVVWLQCPPAYLLEGSSLLVFEIKGSILTTQAKYGFSPDALRDELQKKAITGEPANVRAPIAAHVRPMAAGISGHIWSVRDLLEAA
jgi:hypothetical protein